ncbi:MAG TPA: TetR family transcriptional regulator [Ktedonobacteraceae bacterium]
MEPRRKRGRERVYDAQSTREAILSAAEAIFAERGFAGTSVDAIANEAGYNKSLLFQYFGDKLGLYSQVLMRSDREMSELMERVFGSMTAELADESMLLQAEEFRTFLATMIRSIFDYLLEHPRLLRILTWEMAADWQTLTEIVSQFAPGDRARAEPLFQRAHEAGLLRSDFVPTIQFTMMVPWCQIYLGYLPLYQRILPGEDLASASRLADAREYLVDFIVTGMMGSLPVTNRETCS